MMELNLFLTWATKMCKNASTSALISLLLWNHEGCQCTKSVLLFPGYSSISILIYDSQLDMKSSKSAVCLRVVCFWWQYNVKHRWHLKKKTKKPINNNGILAKQNSLELYGSSIQRYRYAVHRKLDFTLLSAIFCCFHTFTVEVLYIWEILPEKNFHLWVCLCY